MVYIKRQLDALTDEGRPLSKGGNIAALYERRAPLYEKTADLIVENDKTVKDAAERIAEKVGRV